jgi:hypothetical protein
MFQGEPICQQASRLYHLDFSILARHQKSHCHAAGEDCFAGNVANGPVNDSLSPDMHCFFDSLQLMQYSLQMDGITNSRGWTLIVGVSLGGAIYCVRKSAEIT